MTRFFAHRPEVAGRGDDPAPEMPLPLAIDHHPRDQRVFPRNQPIGQRRAAAGRRGQGHDFGRPARCQGARKTGGDLGPFGCEVAAFQEERGRHHARFFGKPPRLGQGRRLTFQVFVEPGLPRGPFAALRRLEGRDDRFGLDPRVGTIRLVDQADLLGISFRVRPGEGPRRLVGQVGRRAVDQPGTNRGLDPVQGRAGAPDFGLPGHPPGLVSGAVGFRRHGEIVPELGRGEERLEAVEFGLLDRVGLVVVAAGAADGQAEEDRAGGLGDVVQGVLAAQPLIVQVDHVGIEAIEAGGDEAVRVVRGNLVAGQLEADEPVIRQIAIERRDDPVAIAPHLGPGLVVLEAVGVGIASQVEPVLGPASRRSEGTPAGDRRVSRRRRRPGR